MMTPSTGWITVWCSLVLGCLSVTVLGHNGSPFTGGYDYPTPRTYGSRTHRRHRRQAGSMPFPPGMPPNMPGPFPHPMARMGPGGMFGPFSNRFNQRPMNDQFARRNPPSRVSRTRQTGNNIQQGSRVSPVRQTASTNRMHLLTQNFAGQNRRVQGSGRWSKLNGNLAARNRKAQKQHMNTMFRMNLQSMQQNKIQSSAQMKKAQPLKGLSSANLISDAVESVPNLQQKLGQKNAPVDFKGSQSNGQTGSQDRISGYINPLDGLVTSNQPTNILAVDMTQQQGGVNSLDSGFTNILDNAVLFTKQGQTDFASNIPNESTPINNDPGYIMPVDGLASVGNGLNDMNAASGAMDMGSIATEPQMNGPYDPSVSGIAPSPSADTFVPVWSEQHTYQEMPLTGPGPMDAGGSGVNGPSSTLAADSQNLGVSSQSSPSQTHGNINYLQGTTDLNGAMMNMVDPNGFDSFAADVNQVSSQTNPSQTQGNINDVQGTTDLNGMMNLVDPNGFDSFATDANQVSSQISASPTDLNGVMDPMGPNGFDSFATDVNGVSFNKNDPGYLMPMDGTTVVANGASDMNTASASIDIGPMAAEPQINGPFDPAVTDVGNQGPDMQVFKGMYPAMETGNQGLSADQSSQILQDSSQPVDSSMQSPVQADISGLSAGNQDILFQDPQSLDVAGQMSTPTDRSGMVQYEIYSDNNSPFLDIGGAPQTGVIDPFTSNGQIQDMGWNDPTYAAGMQGDISSNTQGNSGYVDSAIPGSPQANGNFIM